MLVSAPSASKICRLCFKPCLLIIFLYALFSFTALTEYNTRKVAEKANVPTTTVPDDHVTSGGEEEEAIGNETEVGSTAKLLPKDAKKESRRETRRHGERRHEETDGKHGVDARDSDGGVGDRDVADQNVAEDVEDQYPVVEDGNQEGPEVEEDVRPDQQDEASITERIIGQERDEVANDGQEVTVESDGRYEERHRVPEVEEDELVRPDMETLDQQDEAITERTIGRDRNEVANDGQEVTVEPDRRYEELHHVPEVPAEIPEIDELMMAAERIGNARMAKVPTAEQYRRPKSDLSSGRKPEPEVRKRNSFTTTNDKRSAKRKPEVAGSERNPVAKESRTPDSAGSELTIADFYKMVKNVPPNRCSRVAQIGGKYIRSKFGKVLDGQKAVCLASPSPRFKRIEPGNCIVYSFGVGYDWSFEFDAVKTLKCKVYAFDPDSKYPGHSKDYRVKPGFWFYNRGIGANNGYVIGDGGSRWRMQTLSSLMKELGHTKRYVDLIKMDIQGWEWPAFKDIIESGALKKVNHLCIELHLTPSEMKEQIRVLRSVENIGFRLFSAHPNPFVWSTFVKEMNGREKLQYELAWFRL